jgi:hypothetical protein
MCQTVAVAVDQPRSDVGAVTAVDAHGPVAVVPPPGNRFDWNVAYSAVPGSPMASVVGTRIMIAAATARIGAQ